MISKTNGYNGAHNIFRRIHLSFQSKKPGEKPGENPTSSATSEKNCCRTGKFSMGIFGWSIGIGLEVFHGSWENQGDYDLIFIGIPWDTYFYCNSDDDFQTKPTGFRQCQFLKRTLIYKMEVFLMGFFFPYQWRFQWETTLWTITLSQTFHKKLADLHQYHTMKPFFFDNFVGQSGCFHPSNLNCIPNTIQARFQNGFVLKRVIFQNKWVCLKIG